MENGQNFGKPIEFNLARKIVAHSVDELIAHGITGAEPIVRAAWGDEAASQFKTAEAARIRQENATLP